MSPQSRILRLLSLFSTQKEDIYSYTKLIEFMNDHIETCPENDCPIKLAKKPENDFIDPLVDTVAFLESIKRLFKETMHKQNRIAMKLLYTSFLMEYLDQPKKAMEGLLILETMSTGFNEKFLIYRQKKIIEDNFSSSKKTQTGASFESHKTTNIDIVGIIAVQSQCKIVVSCIQQLSEFHKNLWVELLKPVPSFIELFVIGQQIKMTCQKVEQNWFKLGQLSGNNSLITKLYAKYLKYIKSDLNKSNEIMTMFNAQVTQTMRINAREFTEMQECKRNESVSICVFKKKIYGQFIKVNPSFLVMFGMLEKEAIKLSIHQILPDVYKSHHKKPQTAWFGKLAQTSNYLGKEQQYFVKDKNNWIFPVICSTVQFPGSELAGVESMFITTYRHVRSMENLSIMITSNTGSITGVNRMTQVHFNISPTRLQTD